ncbi:MAG TPA: sterol desaturase family protein, partial [Kofleriaceae bacterium]|nr:sterol desaturase family protein [Kofleriaceae bacterium]
AAVTVLVSGALVAVVLGLERVRPQQPCAPRDESLAAEVAHVLLGAEVGTLAGYGLGVTAGGVLADLHAGVGLWPDAWPVAAQVVLALLVADVVSYAQHRAIHRVPWLWPLHALHHQPRRLDVVKAGRFHVVDFATATAAAYLPLVALGAPAAMLAWVAIVTAVLGVLQHADVRMPTPAWLDAVVCTPAAHWRHHGRAAADDGNFATVCMLVDRALGTFVATGGTRPAALGLARDPLPAGWLPSVLAPFTRRRR